MNNNIHNDHSSNDFAHYNIYYRISIVLGVIAVLYIISLSNYLLFHSIAEGFSIVIACGIFMIIWNSKKYIENNFFIIISIAYLFVSLIDFIHAVSYSGVNIFPGKETNLPTQLWIAARYMQSISMLIAIFLIGKRIKIYRVYCIYFISLLLIFLSIFYLQIFPACYVEGIGLTTFKKSSEFIIAFLFFLSILLLYRKKEEFAPLLFMLVISSNVISIASELNFTLYTAPESFSNFTGHILKIFAFYLVYKAIIVSGLQDPFNTLFKKLRQKEKAFQLTRFSIDHAKGLFIWIKLDGRIYDFNNAVTEILGYSKEKLPGISFFDLIHNSDAAAHSDFISKIKRRESFLMEHVFVKGESNLIEMEIELNYLQFEGDEYYCAIARDITERRKAEEQLMESEARFRNLADTAPVMIWMCGSDKQCNYINKPWLEFTGRSYEEELGFGWAELIHPDDESNCMENFIAAFDKKSEYIVECRMKRHDGQYRWIMNTGIPRFTKDGSFLGYIGSCIDITELKRSREQLENSLKEKVVLLKEIHHRVKNNLQVISSLFNLQSDFIHDEEAKEIFQESQNRVKSMALLHEKLYLSKNSSYINFSDYLRDLITNLFNSYRYKLNTIGLELNIEDLEMNVDTAVYLGLIVNELVSNSFKHAFPEGKGFDGSKSRLAIYLTNLGENKYTIIIKDNGCGFPENLDFRNTNSLGMQLVNSLVDQIKGTIELKKESGTELIVTFKIIN